MNDQTMMLILVMAFFMLGCRFSCSGMKEGFAGCGDFCNNKTLCAAYEGDGPCSDCNKTADDYCKN
jgi:hypothetical protein